MSMGGGVQSSWSRELAAPAVLAYPRHHGMADAGARTCAVARKQPSSYGSFLVFAAAACRPVDLLPRHPSRRRRADLVGLQDDERPGRGVAGMSVLAKNGRGGGPRATRRQCHGSRRGGQGDAPSLAVERKSGIFRSSWGVCKGGALSTGRRAQSVRFPSVPSSHLQSRPISSATPFGQMAGCSKFLLYPRNTRNNILVGHVSCAGCSGDRVELATHARLSLPCARCEIKMRDTTASSTPANLRVCCHFRYCSPGNSSLDAPTAFRALCTFAPPNPRFTRSKAMQEDQARRHAPTRALTAGQVPRVSDHPHSAQAKLPNAVSAANHRMHNF